MKKILFVSFLLFPLYVHADIASGSDCGESCSWSISDDGTLTISGKGAMYDYNYPNSVAVTPTPWDAYKDKVQNIKIENGITRIGSHAFYALTSKDNIEIPKSVTTLANDAFFHVTTPEIIVPDSVTSIGTGAFKGISSAQITLPNSITSIPYETFRGSGNLKNVIIPEGVMSIAYSAFSLCSGLESIVISDNTHLEEIFYDRRSNNNNIDTTKIKIYCLGDLNKCRENAGSYTDLVVQASAKIINGKTYIMDKNGNIVAMSGTRTNKRIYTVEEANTVAGKKNSVMIRYK